MKPPEVYVDALLTPREAADVLRVSERTLASWRYQGMGPAYVKVGSAVRYRPDALGAFCEDVAP
jgi:predicted site-specific integrase-resolvase